MIDNDRPYRPSGPNTFLYTMKDCEVPMEVVLDGGEILTPVKITGVDANNLLLKNEREEFVVSRSAVKRLGPTVKL